MMSMASHMDAHRPDRVPARIPFRFPAWLRSWHGDPPVMTSTGSTVDQSTFVTSQRFGTSGWWWAMTDAGPLSSSAYHVSSVSRTDSRASSMPPN
jgi:hypothetical protein